MQKANDGWFVNGSIQISIGKFIELFVISPDAKYQIAAVDYFRVLFTGVLMTVWSDTYRQLISYIDENQFYLILTLYVLLFKTKSQWLLDLQVSLHCFSICLLFLQTNEKRDFLVSKYRYL